MLSSEKQRRIGITGKIKKMSGNGRGGGQGNSVKRKPNTPVGGLYKDQHRDINSDEMDYEEEECTEVTYNRRSPQCDQQ